MSMLPAPIIRYNGFTFPVETHTTGLQVEPIPSEDGRTISRNRYTFTIETVLVGTSIDASTRATVRALTKNARPFTYSGTGLGVTINVGRVRDARWGPVPLSCDVKPLGGGNAVKLVWRVSCGVPDCADAVYQFAMMDFAYSITYDVDSSHYTKRTHSGSVTIPMTRSAAGGGLPPDSADFYRERITPTIPFGFERTPGTFVLSPDRSRLDFTIVDEQMAPNIPPAGIIRVAADHGASCPPANFVTWNFTTSATYELARGSGSTSATARDAFFRFLKDRVGFTLAEIKRLGVGAVPPIRPPGGIPPGLLGFVAGAPGGIVGSTIGAIAARLLARRAGARLPVAAEVLPTQFSFSEPEVYGRTKCRYSFSYTVYNANLTDILGISGLWRPTPDSNWNTWVRTLGVGVLTRGHAGLVFSLDDDSLVDLCRPSPAFAPAPLGGAGGGAGMRGTGAARGRGGSLAEEIAEIFPPPEPDASWLHWEDSVGIEPHNNVVPVVTLPVKVPLPVNDIFGGSGHPSKVAPVDQTGGSVQRRK